MTLRNSVSNKLEHKYKLRQRAARIQNPATQHMAQNIETGNLTITHNYDENSQNSGYKTDTSLRMASPPSGPESCTVMDATTRSNPEHRANGDKHGHAHNPDLTPHAVHNSSISQPTTGTMSTQTNNRLSGGDDDPSNRDGKRTAPTHGVREPHTTSAEQRLERIQWPTDHALSHRDRLEACIQGGLR